MPIALRTAVLADVPALRTIYRDASLSNAGDRAVLLDTPAALELSDANVRHGAVRVAADGDEVVGFATVVDGDEPGEAELEDLFVAPAAMRRGIATLLVADARHAARARGHVRLAVTANPHADAFYAAVGFRGGTTVATEFGQGRRLSIAV